MWPHCEKRTPAVKNRGDSARATTTVISWRMGAATQRDHAGDGVAMKKTGGDTRRRLEREDTATVTV